MFTRIFNTHKSSATRSCTTGLSISALTLGLIAVFLFQVGCSGKTVEVAIPDDHPANAEAPQTAFEVPTDVLTEDMASHEEGELEHHGTVSLSEAGEEALGMMLDTYFAIGDQLASDTMDDVNTKAHAMLEAFHTLEHEVPAELSEAIHDHGHELGDLSDIKAARIAYGSLSDVFSQFVTATGVPVSYEKPVYSYVCGMARDVPQGGIWLQMGSNVRNPYFGSTMLKCHSEKAQLPVASTTMSEHEDMEGHEHMKDKGEHEHHHGVHEEHHEEQEEPFEHEQEHNHHDGHKDEAHEHHH